MQEVKVVAVTIYAKPDPTLTRNQTITFVVSAYSFTPRISHN